MNLIDFKEAKQREVLKLIGEKFLEISQDAPALDVECTLDMLQVYFLDPLSEEDFFGTEGWEYWLGLE